MEGGGWEVGELNPLLGLFGLTMGQSISIGLNMFEWHKRHCPITGVNPLLGLFGLAMGPRSASYRPKHA